MMADEKRFRVGHPSSPSDKDPCFNTEEEAIKWIEKEQSEKAWDGLHAIWDGDEMVAIICDQILFIQTY